VSKLCQISFQREHKACILSSIMIAVVTEEKKMPTTLTFSGTPTNYVPAELKHDTNGWYILYYDYNPVIRGLERRRIRLNMLRRRCSSTAMFRVQVSDMIKTINNQLILGLAQMTKDGNLPLGNLQDFTPEQRGEIIQHTIEEKEPICDNVRYFTSMEDMMDNYLKEKKADLRADSYRSYNSFCNMFKKWLAKRMPGCKCIHFKEQLAVEYLDYLLHDKKISHRTYNNNLKMGRALFAWAIKKCYLKDNPFDRQETKRVHKKTRTIIPADAQIMIDNWFKKNNPAMCIIMRLVYTSLLRPVEITRIQVSQIDFQKHCIHMPSDKTKNWEARDARMDTELENMLYEHIFGANPNAYLFSAFTWKCGMDPMNPNRFTKEWERMRANLLDGRGERLIPDEYQLYSLKDTAINGMIKSGVDDLSVMQAAGHKDLKMTRIYADHTDSHLIDDLNEAAPKFGEAVVKSCRKAPEVQSTR